MTEDFDTKEGLLYRLGQDVAALVSRVNAATVTLDNAEKELRDKREMIEMLKRTEIYHASRLDDSYEITLRLPRRLFIDLRGAFSPLLREFIGEVFGRSIQGPPPP